MMEEQTLKLCPFCVNTRADLNNGVRERVRESLETAKRCDKPDNKDWHINAALALLAGGEHV